MFARSTWVVIETAREPGDVLARLVAVSCDFRPLQYLVRGYLGPDDPVFRGTVSGASVHLARFESACGRNSFAAWFRGSMVPVDHGRTELRGSIALSRGAGIGILWVCVVGFVIVVAQLIGGLVTLARGHSAGAIFVVAPLIMIAIVAVFFRYGTNSFYTDAQELRADLEEALRVEQW